MVVLFHPSEAHIQNLFHLKCLCEDVVAIDNSPEVDGRLHEQIRAKGIDILPNFNKSGCCRAYNKGFTRLIEMGCQILCIFDQDSQIPEAYFTGMSDACLSLDSSCFMIGPKVLDINVGRYLPAHILHPVQCRILYLLRMKICGLLPCSSLITSGSIMSAETYRTLGPFMEEYFIDQVDTEYSFRAVVQGVPIYVNQFADIKHEVSHRIDHKILFLKLTQWNMGPLRQYYSARNCIHIARQYGARFPIVVVINFLTMGKSFRLLCLKKLNIRKRWP